MIASPCRIARKPEFVALVDALETEQLVERALRVLVGYVHDRVELHGSMLSHLDESSARSGGVRN
jgi:hypothetical protein